MLTLDPLDFSTHYTRGAFAFLDGDFHRAAQRWRELFERYPSSAHSALSHAVGLIYNGESDAAFPIIDHNAAQHPGNAVAKVGLVLKYGLLEDGPRAHGEMDPHFVKTCQRDCTLAHHVASAFAALGETDEALKWLEAAVDAGFLNYPMLAEYDPLLATVRGEERFKKLMVRVKKEWEEFEV